MQQIEGKVGKYVLHGKTALPWHEPGGREQADQFRGRQLCGQMDMRVTPAQRIDMGNLPVAEQPGSMQRHHDNRPGIAPYTDKGHDLVGLSAADPQRLVSTVAKQRVMGLAETQ